MLKTDSLCNGLPYLATSAGLPNWTTTRRPSLSNFTSVGWVEQRVLPAEHHHASGDFASNDSVETSIYGVDTRRHVGVVFGRRC